jgi:hypothetical protein
MNRYFVAGILAVLGLSAVAFAADDFWVKKDWKEWTAAECEKMLQDSPWAKTILVENQTNANNFSSIQRDAANTTAGTKLYGVGEIQYFVQILSSETIRRAYVRQQQLRQGYSKMDEAQKKEFDAKMDEKLQGSRPDVLAFHLVLTSRDNNLTAVVAKAWQNATAGSIPKDLILITDKGVHVTPNEFGNTPGTDREYDFTFLRAPNGEPIIEDGAKTIKIQFPYPAIGDFDKGKKIVEFKLDKMTKDGKPDY